MGGPRRTKVVLRAVSIALLLTPAGVLGAQTRPDAEMFRGPRCFGTVMPGVTTTEGRILGSRDAGKAVFAEGDVIYVGGIGRASAGEELLIYRIEGEVENPLDGAWVGRIVFIAGRLEILDVEDERALARVGPSCGEVEVGDRLVRAVAGDTAAEPELPDFDPNRLLRPLPDDGVVVYGSSESLYAADTETGRRAMTIRGAYSVGDVLTVDRGESHGWGRGDVVLFYDARRPIEAEGSGHDEPVIVGQGYVIWSEAETVAVVLTHGDRTTDLGARARRLTR